MLDMHISSWNQHRQTVPCEYNCSDASSSLGDTFRIFNTFRIFKRTNK